MVIHVVTLRKRSYFVQYMKKENCKEIINGHLNAGPFSAASSSSSYTCIDLRGPDKASKRRRMAFKGVGYSHIESRQLHIDFPTTTTVMHYFYYEYCILYLSFMLINNEKLI